MDTINTTKFGLQVTSKVRSLIAEDTVEQSSSKQWFSVLLVRQVLNRLVLNLWSNFDPKDEDNLSPSSVLVPYTTA